MMKLIERPLYLNRLKSVIGTPDIKVITGVRRSGKSKLMDAFYQYLTQEDPSRNVIRIKLNLKENEALLDAEHLYQYVESAYVSGRENTLLIDEVQLCAGFEKIINSFYEEEKFDIYLTGSNAFLQSSDLATLFGGRVFEIAMYPFSFREYLDYYPGLDVDDAFDAFTAIGGMSGAYLYRNRQDQLNYLRNVYQTTILRDIVDRYRLNNEDLLRHLAEYLMDTVGNRTSYRKLANTLTSRSYATNDKTVASYLTYLCRSFLFYPVRPYNIKGKRYLESDTKYYLSDLGFRFAVIGTKDADYGHLYENMVAMELLRRGYEVYVGKLYDKEVDFVAIKDGEKTYIQVSDDISREETFQREITPLLAIRDAYPKMIIARTKHPEAQKEGVRIVDIARWLRS